MPEYDNTNRATVFRNDKKGNEKAPDFTGTVNVNGKDWAISLWKTTSKNGLEYLSGQVQEPREKKSQESGPVDVSQIPF